jgi:hypothetical protein
MGASRKREDGTCASRPSKLVLCEHVRKLGKYLTYNPVVNLVSITDTNYKFSPPGTLFIVKSFATSILNLEDNLKTEEFLSCK